MKALIIVSIVLGVFFLYFVATAEKPSIKGGELSPRGMDVPKVVLDGAKALKAMIIGDKSVAVTGKNATAVGDSVAKDSVPTLINKIKNTAEDVVSKTIEKAKELVKDPIEQKISEVFCPVK